MVRTAYLGERWLPGGSMGGAVVGVLVRSGGGGCPLVGVAQRCEVATVLDARAPLKLLAHAVAVKCITLTGFTLGNGENERGGFMKEYKAWFLNLAVNTHPPLLDSHPNLFVSEPNLSKSILCFRWPLVMLATSTQPYLTLCAVNRL